MLIKRMLLRPSPFLLVVMSFSAPEERRRFRLREISLNDGGAIPRDTPILNASPAAAAKESVSSDPSFFIVVLAEIWSLAFDSSPTSAFCSASGTSDEVSSLASGE